MKRIIVILFFLLSGVGLSTSAWAQEVPPPIEGESAEAAEEAGSEGVLPESNEESTSSTAFELDPTLPFTGTLAEDDPENEELQREQELFGSEEEAETEDVEGEEEEASHLLQFNFTSHLQFIVQPTEESTAAVDQTLGEPYMEIEYTTQFEIPLNLKERRQLNNIDAEYEVQNWGSLARNEFFDCRLEIAIPQIPVEITTRLKKEVQKDEETDDEEVINYQLAIKVDFGDEAVEDWFSLCTDVSGAILNTQGETEDYNLQVLKLVEPSIKALVLEEYDPEEEATIPLTVESTIITDDDIANDIVMYGDGSVTIEPL